eukprot:COSAG06_NODE_3470_length_5297_cov_18.285879_4_plen_83_part_00
MRVPSASCGVWQVAVGRVLKTSKNMDGLVGKAPEGYDSIHGEGDPTRASDMNYDEIVVYHEEAVLPYALVTYDFVKNPRRAP